MSEIEKPAIKNRKVTVDGKIHTIKELKFTKENLLNIGKLFAETKREKTMFFDSSDNLEDGVFIYQDRLNPNVGYRIYKEFLNPGFYCEPEDKLVAKLQEKQKVITKTNFPTGVITLDGKIIGQEILLYLNHVEVHKYIRQNPDKLSTTSYRQILDILKEMYDNGIGYLDGHAKNFVVDKNSGHVEIIDFEWGKMKFDSVLKSSSYTIFNNLNSLINRCNENGRVNDILSQAKFQTFSEAYEYVEEAEYKLIKSKRYCK